MGAFIAKMLLPTVSSLVLLPTASVAAKRGFHMEAMVYFFTMFFAAVRNLLRFISAFVWKILYLFIFFYQLCNSQYIWLTVDLPRM